MKRLLLLLALTVLLGGCNSLARQDDIRPAAATNDSARANLNLAIEYMRLGNYDTALAKLDRAYQADPRYYATHNVYGLLYQQLNEDKKAEQHFKKALSLNKNDSQTMNNYAGFLCQKGQLDKAETIFMRAAANPLYETPAVPYTNAGICAWRAGQRERAEQYFRRALALNPQIAMALMQMAQLTFEQDKFMSARAYLQRYQQIAAPTPQSLWLGIQVERILGDQDAVASYSLLLKNNYPDSKEASLLKDSRLR